MPITKSAKKALRSSGAKRVVNIRRKRVVEDAVKGAKEAAQSAELKAVKAAISLAYKAIDKAAKAGLMKKNNASRKKSQLAKLVQKFAKK